MRAIVVSVGSELLEGYLTDTNATFLAQEMSLLGLDLVGVSQVGDNLERIVLTLQRGWQDADLIVSTGGIGPTDDDLTREAIASLLGEQPRVDPELLATIAAFFRSRGSEMPQRNQKQAWLIPSAEALPNPMGTAPGWFTRRGGQVIVSMPGVPREMRRMWREQAVPRLLPYLGDRVIVSRTLKTIGIGESSAEQAIVDLIERGRPVIATYAKDDGVHIRITATGDDRSETESVVDAADRDVRDRLGDFVYGLEDVSLGAALLAPLVASGRTLAVSESGSGGRITTLIAEEPASVIHYQGGLVRAFEPVAIEHGVELIDSGASKRVAALEADAVRRARSADFGFALALRMQAGESADRTRGEMAFALAGPDGGFWSREQTFSAIPSELRRRAGLWGAEFLRSALLRATNSDALGS